MKNRIFALMAVLVCAAGISSVSGKPPKHAGERKMLEVDIEFLRPSGWTVTSAQGVSYNYSGRVITENKVYPPQYWGRYPLYFEGNPAYIKVTVTNRGPRAKAKLQVKTEAYVLRTDGSSGFSGGPGKGEPPYPSSRI